MIQQLVLNGVIAGAIYALVGLGFALAYRTVRFFHFAHGAVYAAGAYSAYAALQLLGASGWLLARSDWRLAVCVAGEA